MTEMTEHSIFVQDSLPVILRGVQFAHPEVRLDDNDSIFMARQLEHIEAQLYEYDLRPLKHRQHIPVDNSPDPGADTITYRMWEKIGMARIISNYADDLPRADIVGQEFTAKVKPLGTSFGYSTHDIRKSKMTNIPLDTMKGEAAQRAMDEQESEITWNGHTESNLEGFLTHPNVPQLQAALNAGSTSRAWADKTPTEIIEDVRDMVSKIRDQTKGARVGNTLLVPIAQYDILALTPFSPTGASDLTIMEWITKPGNSFGLREVDWVDELAGAGPSVSDVAMFYDKNPSVIQQRITMERVVLPVQQKNLEFMFPVEARNGGVVIRFPLATLMFYDI